MSLIASLVLWDYTGPSSCKKKTSWVEIFGIAAGLGAGSNAGASLGAGLSAGASFGPNADLCASSPSPLSRWTSTSALLQEASSGANLNASELYACLDNDSVDQYDNNFNVLN